jgi:hypothetical protein
MSRWLRMGRCLDREPRLRWLIIGIGIVVALQVIWFLFVFFFVVPRDMPARGQFGDLFGGVNAFFTGLAFAGLVFTILLQRYDLRSQGKELRESTRLSIMATLADIYTRQIDVMERGNFRGHLWKAECGVHTWARRTSSKQYDEEAMKTFMDTEVMKTFMDTKRYRNFMVDVAPYIEFPELRDEEASEIDNTFPEQRNEETTKNAKATKKAPVIGMNNPLFRYSFEEWRRYHRELDRLSSELEGKLKEIEERQEQAPPENT